MVVAVVVSVGSFVGVVCVVVAVVVSVAESFVGVVGSVRGLGLVRVLGDLGGERTCSKTVLASLSTSLCLSAIFFAVLLTGFGAWVSIVTFSKTVFAFL